MIPEARRRKNQQNICTAPHFIVIDRLLTECAIPLKYGDTAEKCECVGENADVKDKIKKGGKDAFPERR